MATRDSSRPIASVMTQVVSDLAFLLQTEIKLVRAEIGEKLSNAVNGGVFIGIAVVLLLSGVVLLLLAAVRWLEVAGLPDQWGFLLVGAAAASLGVALALKGVNSFKGSALVPDRTIDQVRADYSVVKEHVS